MYWKTAWEVKQTCPQTCFSSVQEGLVSTFAQFLTSAVSLNKRGWLVSDMVLKAAMCSLPKRNLTESSICPEGAAASPWWEWLSHSTKAAWIPTYILIMKGFLSPIFLPQSLSYPVPIKLISFPALAPCPFSHSSVPSFLTWCAGKVLSKSTLQRWFWARSMWVRGDGFFPPIVGIKHWGCLCCNYSW